MGCNPANRPSNWGDTALRLVLPRLNTWRVTVGLSGLALLFGHALAGADQVRVVLSSEDGSHGLSEVDPLAWVVAADTSLPTIEVHQDRPRQSMLGLGASLEHATCENLTRLPPQQRAAVMEKLVDPQRGIGMNLMRICIGTSDFVGQPYYTYNDLPEGQTDPELSGFSIEPDRAYVLPIIKLALEKNPDLLIFASPWSPPAWMKDSGQLGTGSVQPEFYPAYARYLLKFIQAYEREGIPIHAITVQNEPQHVDRRYPTTLWTGPQQRFYPIIWARCSRSTRSARSFGAGTTTGTSWNFPVPCWRIPWPPALSTAPRSITTRAGSRRNRHCTTNFPASRSTSPRARCFARGERCD